MKTKQIRATWMVLLGLLLLADTTPAFYNPTVGKWISRDPIEERGGRNLTAFVGNDPMQRIDSDGRYWWVVPIIIVGAGCSSDDCECEGRQVKKKPVETGVRTHKWFGQPVPSGVATHHWITWNGGSADANSYALLIQPGDGVAKSPAGQTPDPSESHPLKLSPCEYDFRKLNECLTRLAAEWDGKRFGMCWDFPPFLIESCKRESKGCTPL